MGESLHEGPQPDNAIHRQTDRSTQASLRSWEVICFACFPLPGNSGRTLPATLFCHLVPHGKPSETCFSQATVILHINLVSYRTEGCTSQAETRNAEKEEQNRDTDTFL